MAISWKPAAENKNHIFPTPNGSCQHLLNGGSKTRQHLCRRFLLLPLGSAEPELCHRGQGCPRPLLKAKICHCLRCLWPADGRSYRITYLHANIPIMICSCSLLCSVWGRSRWPAKDCCIWCIFLPCAPLMLPACFWRCCLGLCHQPCCFLSLMFLRGWKGPGLIKYGCCHCGAESCCLPVSASQWSTNLGLMISHKHKSSLGIQISVFVCWLVGCLLAFCLFFFCLCLFGLVFLQHFHS